MILNTGPRPNAAKVDPGRLVPPKQVQASDLATLIRDLAARVKADAARMQQGEASGEGGSAR